MKRKILIIDDEENIIDTLKYRLELEENLEVKSETNPIKAIELIEKEKFHIVLTDIMMPEMDGITLLKKIKEIDGLIQVIIMTGFTTTEKAIECLNAGANDYILKPFDDLEEIVKLLNYSIEKLNRWDEIVKKSFKR
ncbi:MAG TPA: response regulator [bacterium]|nr:response regulator [bacterium]HOL48159.1 response regulator [bacterium]HPQ17760.1 response regulator [bacterium]